MLEALVTFLIWLLVIGLIFYVVVWVLGILGIAIPPRVVQIIGAIIFLILLLWFLQAVLGGGGLPRLGKL